ncbi:MAG TPA: alpha/beta fold hydrolase [Acidimicrobiia bacterium]|nr:alpha/beta fold hydrolase [Acidimicrobiia bacterium]
MLVTDVRARILRVLTALTWMAGALALITAGLWLAQRQIVYLPDRGVPTAPDDVEIRTAETLDGIVHQVWLVPAEGEPVARVLVFNGNAGNKADRLPLARNLAVEGMEVVLFDYRGYGGTAGSPTEEGLGTDAETLAEIVSDSPLPVVFFGESLGGGVATGLAARLPPDALVLRSPFTSLGDMARVHYPLVPSFLIRDRYPIEDQIATIAVPILVVLGTSDSIVPPALSRRVFEAASAPKEIVEMEGMDHNDPGLSSGVQLTATVRGFLERAGLVSP